MGEKGSEGIPGEIGPRGYKGSKGEIGSKGVNGAGIPGMTGPRGPSGYKGERGMSGLKGQKGNTANIDPRQLANWKQCAWSSGTGTGVDSGKIKECSFNKLHQNTALKVSYQGNLRLHNSNRKCNRWYFKFNGNECSGPLPVDSVLYTYDSSTPIILRSHFFEGFCENLPQGTVRVELWVGSCPGEELANAYTGWNSVSRIMIEEVPPSQ
ncbi:Collagen triple helix repeat-containing protein 1 [Stylophora pistillata]|uniref:Collagen triple helix repeat-containing protein 1 n=1 Tax=Stylophora pistillata TaxID=50429 RepID=A0A2B4RE79_STYPI|nr:Collagen triple helix repeat-containing protein 1 [Stylophora pistillata]